MRLACTVWPGASEMSGSLRIFRKTMTGPSLAKLEKMAPEPCQRAREAKTRARRKAFYEEINVGFKKCREEVRLPGPQGQRRGAVRALLAPRSTRYEHAKHHRREDSVPGATDQVGRGTRDERLRDGRAAVQVAGDTHLQAARRGGDKLKKDDIYQRASLVNAYGVDASETRPRLQEECAGVDRGRKSLVDAAESSLGQVGGRDGRRRDHDEAVAENNRKHAGGPVEARETRAPEVLSLASDDRRK